MLQPIRPFARTSGVFAATLLALTLAGCQTGDLNPAANATPAPAASAQADVQPDDITAAAYYPSDQPLRLAEQYFKDGAYGLAERYYRDAVEKAPRDLTAWIGLAASYDHLARFDLADRAYNTARNLGGETVQLLNNEGYSYLLRGNLTTARAKFNAALKRDPHNITIENNLKLLASSAAYIKRSQL